MSEVIKDNIEEEPTGGINLEKQILEMYQKIQKDKEKLFKGKRAEKPEDIIVNVDNLKEEICKFDATDPTAPEKMIEIINEKKKEFEERKKEFEEEKDKEVDNNEKFKHLEIGIRNFAQKIKKLEEITEAYNSGDLKPLRNYTQRKFEELLVTIRGKEDEELKIKEALFFKKVINTISLEPKMS